MTFQGYIINDFSFWISSFLSPFLLYYHYHPSLQIAFFNMIHIIWRKCFRIKFDTVSMPHLALFYVTDTVTPWLCHKTGASDDSIRTLDRLIGAIKFSSSNDIEIRKFQIAMVLSLRRILFIINFYLFSLISFFSAFIRFINEQEHKSCYRNVGIKCIVDTQDDSISLPVYLATKIFKKRYRILSMTILKL